MGYPPRLALLFGEKLASLLSSYESPIRASWTTEKQETEERSCDLLRIFSLLFRCVCELCHLRGTSNEVGLQIPYVGRASQIAEKFSPKKGVTRGWTLQAPKQHPKTLQKVKQKQKKLKKISNKLKKTKKTSKNLQKIIKKTGAGFVPPSLAENNLFSKERSAALSHLARHVVKRLGSNA